MSQFNRRDLSKKTEKLQKEISNSSPLWSKTMEEEQQDMQRVKKKWQRKQYQQYNRLQHQQKEKKNIKTIISSLVTVTIVALVIPYLPYWWQLTANFMSESSSPDQEKITRETKGKNKGSFFSKLKELSDKQGQRQAENKIQINNPTLSPSMSCDSDSTLCTSTNNSSDEKVDLEDKLVDSLDNINEYNDNLQKMIEMSDGKNVSLEEK